MCFWASGKKKKKTNNKGKREISTELILFFLIPPLLKAQEYSDAQSKHFFIGNSIHFGSNS